MIRVSKFKRRVGGYWYIRYWVGGRMVDESTRTRDEAQATRAQVKREVELNAGIQPVRHGDVGALLDRYLSAFPPKTSLSHRREATRILSGFIKLSGRKRQDGSFRLRTDQITPELIDRYVNKRPQGQLYDGTRRDTRGRRVLRYRAVSNVTLRKELTYLSGFFSWCCRQRPPFLRENPIPLSSASNLKDDAKPHFMITEDEFRALLRECDIAEQYLFVLLGWWTGARRSELLALHYYHFDFDAFTLDIRHFKNNLAGVLPISEEIVSIAKRLYGRASENAPVFPVDPFANQAFARLCRKAGIRHHRFHDFRISTSTVIKAGGFDASLAALWVGNQATTNRRCYTDLQPVATRIGSLLQVSDLPPVPWRSV